MCYNKKIGMKRHFFIVLLVGVASLLQAQDLTILHFNDTHSHIEPERGGKHKGHGGVMEQAAYIDSVRLKESEMCCFFMLEISVRVPPILPNLVVMSR